MTRSHRLAAVFLNATSVVVIASFPRTATAIDCPTPKSTSSGWAGAIMGMTVSSCLIAATAELVVATKAAEDTKRGTKANHAKTMLRKRLDFITANYAALRAATAVGKGEYLGAYATLLGCDDATKELLGEVLRRRYALLFAEPADSERTLAYTYIAIQQDAELRPACDVPAPVSSSSGHDMQQMWRATAERRARSPAPPQLRQRLLVLALRPLGGVSSAQAESVDPLILAAVADRTGFDVLGVDDINAMLRVERMRDLVDCNSVTCAAEIGGALGTSLVLHGSVGRLGDDLALNLSLVSSGAGQVQARASLLAPDILGLAASIPEVVDSLVAQLERPSS